MQLSFMLPDPKARKRDPQTSHDAAASMKVAATAQAVKVLMVLRQHGPLGAEQIAILSGLDKFQVCRRLPELYAAGLVAPTGETRKTVAGRQERVWECL